LGAAPCLLILWEAAGRLRRARAATKKSVGRTYAQQYALAIKRMPDDDHLIR
jgi:hypothetical protein